MLEFIQSFWSLFASMGPWLIIGFLAAGLVGILVPRSFISQHLRGSGFWPYLKATVVGIPMPLCSCSVIPTAVSFYKKGASRGATVSFLISTPQTGVDSLFLTSAAFGWPFTLVKVMSATLMGLVGGVLGGRQYLVETEGSDDLKSKESKLKQFITFTFIELPAPLAIPFLCGAGINALVSTWIEPGTLGSYVGQGPFVLFGVLLFSIPLYVCTTASIPLAMLLLDQGLGPGAALVFLIAGPATNTATILMVGNTLGKKGLMAYLGPVIIGSVLIGLLLPNVVSNTLSMPEHHHDGSILNHLCGAVLLLLLIYPICKNSLGRMKSKSNLGEGLHFDLEGLTCQGCVSKAEHALAEQGYKILELDKTHARLEVDEKNVAEVEKLFNDLGFKALKR